MARNIIYVVLFLAVVGVLYLGYTTYDAKREVLSGDVRSADGTISKSSDRADSGSTSGAADTKSSSSPAIVYPTPAASPLTATSQSTLTEQPGQPASGGMSVPGTDSISPEPPNGTAFTGTGKYQFYRQGNITWRLNTETGQTCIVFATDEEWKKPRVLQAGCGSSR